MQCIYIYIYIYTNICIYVYTFTYTHYNKHNHHLPGGLEIALRAWGVRPFPPSPVPLVSQL